MKYKLNSGWKLYKISYLADVNPGKSKPINRKDNEPTSFIPMENVDEVCGKIASLETRTFGEVKKGYTYFENGDVIFAKITPCMQNGKSAIVDNLIGGIGYGSTEFIVLRAKQGISNKWILHFLRTAELRKDAEDHFTGSAGQQRVSTSFISDSIIPYSDNHVEVNKLLPILDKSIDDSLKILNATKRQEEAINALQSSILRKYFAYDSEKELPKGWRFLKLSNRKYFDIINGLWSGKQSPLVPCKVLRNTNFTDTGSLDYSDVPTLLVEKKLLDKRKLESGDNKRPEG